MPSHPDRVRRNYPPVTIRGRCVCGALPTGAHAPECLWNQPETKAAVAIAAKALTDRVDATLQCGLDLSPFPRALAAINEADRYWAECLEPTAETPWGV